MEKEGEGMLVRQGASKILCKDKGDELKEKKTWRNYGGDRDSGIQFDLETGIDNIHKSTEALADFDAGCNMGIGFDARCNMGIGFDARCNTGIASDAWCDMGIGLDARSINWIVTYLVLIFLPTHFGQFKVSYNTQKDKWPLNEIISHSVQEEERLLRDKT
ncbi:hypothetical protein Lal_00042422 [Lupinus albus]|nr:hypothetical protein Lal_00042422 [Lupinus albus]